ncbi:MAG: restriction endonuclease subunit S, partial [Candidatus Gastranaerophilales bacterium]|nr:restriction endonuclease subunit S [Candidatus Gastranaerophilales bacterium]
MNSCKFSYLNFINFSELKLWDFKRYVFNKINSTYPIVKLADYIKEENLKIKPFDFPKEKFEILGVNNKIGLFDAYVEIGQNINQQYKIVNNGFLVYNPYRINVGSIGLKTNEQKYKYISPAYVVFSCKEGLLSKFLYIMFKTNKFNELIRENTTGSVRQTLSFNSMGQIKMPLPSIKIQQEIVDKYNKKIKLAEEQEKEINNLEKEIEMYLLNNLGLSINQKSDTKSSLSFIDFSKLVLWGADKILGVNLFSCKKYKLQSLIENPSIYLEVFRGKSPKYDDSNSIILNQKCNRWNYIDMTFAKTVSKTWLDSIDNNFKTKIGDVLINSTGEGTIGRASCITEKNTGLLYDSHILLLRLNTKIVNPLYYTYLFNSSFGQEQLNLVKSAQSTKQTELGIDNLKKIKFPYPDIDIQNDI